MVRETPPRTGRAGPRRGVTLLEVLVAIGIIAILASFLMPAISRMRESSRRAEELSSLRQLTAACVLYAQDHEGLFPTGRLAVLGPVNTAYGNGIVNAAAGGGSRISGATSEGGGGGYGSAEGDDYTWINYKDCWQPLSQRVQNLCKINSCLSVREGYAPSAAFGKTQPQWGYPDDTQVGWIYWGGRDDLIVNGKLAYRSLHRMGQNLTPGSHTLWTCWCWDSAGNGGPSICPHVRSRCVMYPNGVRLKPPPDGLGISLDDGSASFAAWNDMIIIPQGNGYKLYYQP